MPSTGADASWLAGPITRRVPVADWQEAYGRHPGDIKVVLEYAA